MKISEVLLNNKIEAIIISNTSDTTRENLQNTQSHQKGGLSGKPIELKSSELISKFYKVLKGCIRRPRETNELARELTTFPN